MKLRRLSAAALAAVLLGAAPLPTVYTAPAGTRAAGAPHAALPYDVILPNGRIVAPIGKSVVVGMNALGVALAPGGRYAVVTNGSGQDANAVSRLEPRARGGYSLAVVDTRTMRVTDVYKTPDSTFFLGVAAVKDPANPKRTLVVASGGADNVVRFFILDGRGKLHAGRSAAMPPAESPRYAGKGQAFPGGITISANGRMAYVVNKIGNSVTAVDLARRRAMHSAAVGYFPYGAGVSGHQLYVTDPGLMAYGDLSQPARYPAFANVPFAPRLGSALTSVQLRANGDIAKAVAAIPMDQAPDGVNNVGGAHPSAIAISKDGRYAYVCMTNVDRIAIVSLMGIPRVVGGLQLRLFDKAPYGTQPDAIVRSPDGKRLYVALAGMNAVAVLDASNPAKIHRLGLIPTGWYPTAIAVSPTGRYLYVANAKGIGQEPHFQGDSSEVWSTLQRIDLHKLPLEKTTLSALRYSRVPQRPVANAVVPSLRSLQRSSVIKHVVFILEEGKSYDAMLGDLTDAQEHAYGNGDPALAVFGRNVTPNLHALAREYALADNFYADAEESGAGHQFAAGGIATAYTEKTLSLYQDPEDYPRAGYIFNNAARAGRSYRDYGDLLRVSGYDDGSAADPKTDDPNFAGIEDENAQTSGLGGLYTLDVPALAALSGHVDLNYPGWNPRIRDVRRAKEFIRDYSQLEQQNAVPDLTYVWLPADRGVAGKDLPPVREQVADGDRALGMIVDYLSHQPTWSSTAIFITAADTRGSRDHVNAHRSYALVVSPYAKHGYIGRAHLSTVSVLKTEEEILGLAPLSLGDLLATDMSGFFTATPDPAPYTAIPVPIQSAAVEGGRNARVERLAP